MSFLRCAHVSQTHADTADDWKAACTTRRQLVGFRILLLHIFLSKFKAREGNVKVT